MLGTVDHSGGMLMLKYADGVEQKRLEVTTLRIVNGNMLVGNALGLVPAPTADLINASHSKDPATGVIHWNRRTSTFGAALGPSGIGLKHGKPRNCGAFQCT